MKKIWKHGSTILLLVIITILIVPSWRVSFQGWFQGIFMSDLVFEENSAEEIPFAVKKWEIYELDGQSKLLEEFIGQPILLSFWATWCGPCRTELVELKKLREKYGEALHIVSVSEESIETIKKSALNETYDFLYSTNQYPRFFSVDTYPTLCIIDSEGKLIFKHSGSGGLNNEKNYQFIQGLIEKP
ncbi:MAG: redoxin domain-containing protein [Crocinitomix sp.]|nr:redoxin domain-containing protein [Crocinitomix sp.]